MLINLMRGYKTMRNLKTIWNDLSVTRRDGIKNVAGLAGGFALALAVVPFLAIPLGISIGAGFVITGGLAAYLGVAAGGLLVLPKLPGLIKEIRHGNEEVTWKNTLGQTIKSTQVQQKDLVNAQQKIQYWSQRDPAEVKVISDKFKAVADKATVVQDVENGDNKFHFAQQKTETKVVTKTTVKAL